MRIVLSMIATVAMAACVDPDSEPLDSVDSSVVSEFEPIPLLDPFALTPVDASADPLLQHRPSEIDCPTATWGPEGGSFEVQTGACNYAAFDQPLSTPIRAGDVLDIVVWHDTLDSAEPATAHVAVWLGRTVLWEAEVAIPASSDSFEVSVPIEDAPAPDARLGLHLHNHGFNSWRFVAVDLQM
jgi:hypothetical protein